MKGTFFWRLGAKLSNWPPVPPALTSTWQTLFPQGNLAPTHQKKVPYSVSIRVSKGRDVPWDVPLSLCPRTKKFSCPGVPLSRDKSRSKRPGTNSSVPARPGTKRFNFFLKKRPDFLSQNIISLFQNILSCFRTSFSVYERPFLFQNVLFLFQNPLSCFGTAYSDLELFSGSKI